MSKVNILILITCSLGIVAAVLGKNWSAAIWAATCFIGVLNSATLESHIRILTRKNS